MTIRHLTIFIQVSRQRSMTKAAEALHMTQPSISQAIQELETHYQAKLFERLGRKLFITAAGEKLLTFACHIVNLNAEAEEEMRRFGLVYSVRLGASVTIGQCILIGLLNQLYQTHPARRITSVIHNTAILEKMLLDDQIDIALVEGAVQSEHLSAVPFMKDELIFICAPGCALRRKPSVTAKDLETVDFFVREEGSGTRDLFEKITARRPFKRRVAGIFNNAESIKKAVESGLGVSVISRMAVSGELARGTLAKLDVDEYAFEREFSIVHHKNKYKSTEIKNIIELCQSMDQTV